MTSGVLVTGPTFDDDVVHPTLSVIICTYSRDRVADVRAAVRATLEQLLPGDELLVVVDHNERLREDLTAEVAEGVVVLGNQEERGLSGGRNTGVAVARGEVCVFLDDDALPAPGWLAAFRVRLADRSVTGVAGAVTAAWEGGRPPGWLPPQFGWVVGCDYLGLPGSGAEVRNPIGANMALRTDALRMSGGFAAVIGRVGALPVGCEETDLCIRLRQADPTVRIVRDCGSDVAHRVPRSRQTLRYFLRRCYYEGRSKGVLAARVGAADGLAAERAHALRSLTSGVLNCLADAARGDVVGVARAGAIVLGTAVTTYGFVAVSARPGTGQTGAQEPVGPVDACPPSWRPVRLLDYDLETGTAEPNWEPTSDRVRLLVWSDDRPCAVVDLDAAAALAPRAPEPGLLKLGDEALVRTEPPDRLPHVTVVVPTHGRPAELERCLRSLLTQDHPDYDVLVVDNNPTGPVHDEVTRVVAAVGSDPRVRLLHHPEGGSSGARNRGIAEATGEIVAATDDDVVADRRWLSALAARFDDPTVSCVTGLVVPHGLQTRAQELFEEYGGFGKGFEPRRFDLRTHRDSSPLFPFAAGLYGSGNNVAYRTSAITALGGYDPHLGPGSPVRAGQDLDLFLAMVLSGRALCYEPGAVVRHQHRRTVPELERQLHNYGRGLAAVMTKHVLSDPRVAFAVARRLPLGFYHLLGRGSERNENRSVDYPASLRRAELRGLLEGPGAYVRARADARRAA